MAKVTHEDTPKTTIGPDAEGRYYYTKDGKAAYNIKQTIESLLGEENAAGYVEITKEEWYTLTYVAPHVPTAEEVARNEKVAQINALKGELAKTDYIALKLAEALAYNDNELVEELKTTYWTELENRKTWRAQINTLESELE